MKLVRKQFRAWLEGHRPRQVVARYSACSSDWYCACPIANYLCATGARFCEVDYQYIDIDGQSYRTPKWATKFAEKIDAHVSASRPNVTAQRTLKILDSIESTKE